jgi:hypothetical protein
VPISPTEAEIKAEIETKVKIEIKIVIKMKMTMLNVGIARKRGTFRRTAVLRGKPTRTVEKGKSIKPKRALLLLLELLKLRRKL